GLRRNERTGRESLNNQRLNACCEVGFQRRLVWGKRYDATICETIRFDGSCELGVSAEPHQRDLLALGFSQEMYDPFLVASVRNIHGCAKTCGLEELRGHIRGRLPLCAVPDCEHPLIKVPKGAKVVYRWQNLLRCRIPTLNSELRLDERAGLIWVDG